MAEALRILHLEDDLRDAELVKETLEAAGIGCDVRRVDTREQFEAALQQGEYDLVLADYRLPSYDGHSALKLVRERRPDLPFIIVSGTLGEEAAVASLVGGATDYVLKQRLARVEPAVRRALREAENARERARSECALRASELRYRKLFEGSKDAILILDAESGRILDANPTAAALLGYGRAELVGSTLQDLDVTSGDPDSEACFRRVQEEDHVRMEAVRVWTMDQQCIQVDVMSSAFEVEGHRTVQCSLRDVTERRRLEAQLRQSQKLEAVGQLAGGVAHDFNNILVIINSYVDLAIGSLPEDHAVRQDLLEVQRAGARAAALTRQLLAFSRKQILQPSVFCPNGVLTGLEKMLRRVIGEDIELRFELRQDLRSVRADPAQLEQVIMNLVVNSRDAMPRGGALVIRTDNVAGGNGTSRAVHQDCVMLSVKDSGCGMDRSTLARVFEPFFTTKAVGKGTGLGLSIVYGIVKQSGGEIEVDSAPGEGTTFRVYLPVAGPTLEAAAPAPAPAALSGTETVLVVEDDDRIQALAKRVLAAHGYRILTAPSGTDAERLAERSHEPIHLLLTDIVLPGIDGCELARRVRARRPELKVLYMSGYTDERILSHGPLPAAAFLPKPFTPGDLVRTVRQVLDGSAEAVAAPADAPPATQLEHAI